MGSVEVVGLFPLLQLVVEEVGVVDDEAVEHPVELSFVDGVGSLHLVVEPGRGRFDVDLADAAVEHVIVELGAELSSVVGLDDPHSEGEPGQQVVEDGLTREEATSSMRRRFNPGTKGRRQRSRPQGSSADETTAHVAEKP